MPVLLIVPNVPVLLLVKNVLPVLSCTVTNNVTKDVQITSTEVMLPVDVNHVKPTVNNVYLLTVVQYVKQVSISMTTVSVKVNNVLILVQLSETTSCKELS